MKKLISAVNGLAWGLPTVVAILGVGLYLTLRLRFVQIRLLPAAFRTLSARAGRPDREGIGPIQAMCTALAATVGTGNLVGVAGAICLGGPGAVFWIWVCGLLGMAVKYTEAVLAVRFRQKTPSGCAAGPMYVMLQGLGERFRPLASAYAGFGVIAAFGMGNGVQMNSAAGGVRAVREFFGQAPTRQGDLITGLILAAVLGTVLLGGAKAIAGAASVVVPVAAAGYVAMCVGVLVLRADAVPAALADIFRGAFSPKAVTGGMLGSAWQALRIGCSRGVFTNEAGMGTAAIAHGSAQGIHPVRQGQLGLLEVLLDTLVICTLTALVILVSGVAVPYGTDAGGELTVRAFRAVLGPWASAAVGAELVLFAGATVLGWGFYGLRCAEFLFGSGSRKGFCAAQIPVMVLACVADAAPIWLLSEAVNGLMAVPNLIALVLLAGEAADLTKDYILSGGATAGGGTYADFHQRKPLRTLSYEKVPPSGYGSQERGQEDLSSEYRPA